MPVGTEDRLASAHAELVGHRQLATLLLTVGHLSVCHMDDRGRYTGGVAQIPLENVLAAGPLRPGPGAEWSVAAERELLRSGESPVNVFIFRPRAARAAVTVHGWLLEDLHTLLGDRFGPIPVPARPEAWTAAVQAHASPEGTTRRWRLEQHWAANEEFWRNQSPGSGAHQ